MEALPKLRDLTWEPPEFRPAPYLRNRLRVTTRSGRWASAYKVHLVCDTMALASLLGDAHRSSESTCQFGKFMSILVLLIIAVAAFVLWHFLPQTEARAPRPSPKYRRDARITPDQIRWQSFVEEHCESPAEISFLRAMIEAFNMNPQNGSLVADGVRLDFQVEEGRYRVDFLANEWLVIEIDGAAYHSSPEAKARDGARDRYFEGRGYSVLRIPAKLVFESPHLAVKQVKTALTVGKRTLQSPQSTTVANNGFARLAQTNAALIRSMEKAEKAQAIRQASMVADAAAAKEKQALELTVLQAEHYRYLASLSADEKADYYEARKFLDDARVPSRSE